MYLHPLQAKKAMKMKPTTFFLFPSHNYASSLLIYIFACARLTGQKKYHKKSLFVTMTLVVKSFLYWISKTIKGNTNDFYGYNKTLKNSLRCLLPFESQYSKP